MGGLCLLVEFHWEGLAIKGATQPSFKYIDMEKLDKVAPVDDRPSPF